MDNQAYVTFFAMKIYMFSPATPSQSYLWDSPHLSTYFYPITHSYLPTQIALSTTLTELHQQFYSYKYDQTSFTANIGLSPEQQNSGTSPLAIQNSRLHPKFSENSPHLSTSSYTAPLSEDQIKIQESAGLGNLSVSCKKTGSSKVNQTQNDKEYVPHRSERKVTRKRTRQNSNRNVVPNQINQIISFIQKRTKSGNLVAKLFQKFPQQKQSYNIKRFYLYQGLLKEKMGHYTNENSLSVVNQLYEPDCRIWSEGQQRYYNKICRLLVRHFLLEDSIFIILTSKRMKSQKKIDHLRARRCIAQKVFQIFRSG